MSLNTAIDVSSEASYSEILSCAIDPNDKQVWPQRKDSLNSNYTRNDETLEYLIRFQNTGNDTAFTVRIVDELDGNLNIASFNFISSSHPCRTTIDENGKLDFVFENILLPDSNVNEALSHGFVSFRINVDEGLDDFYHYSEYRFHLL